MIKAKLVVVMCVLMTNYFTFSQEKENNKEERHYVFETFDSVVGFGGPVLQFSSIDNKFSLFTGLKGGIILNHKIVLGLEGYYLNTIVESKNYINRDLDFTYGGLFIGYIFNNNAKVHLLPSLLIGWGGIEDELINDENSFFKFSDDLVVLQPSLELEINVSKYLRFGISTNYRYVAGVDLRNYTNSDFASFGGAIALKFGKF